MDFHAELKRRQDHFAEDHTIPDHPSIQIGSGRDVDTVFPDGCHFDPHGNFYQDIESERCIRMKIVYWNEREKQLAREFYEAKNELKDQLRSGDKSDVLDKEQLTELKQLQQDVLVLCPKMVEQAEWELSLFPFRNRSARITQLRHPLSSSALDIRGQKDRLARLRQTLSADPDNDALRSQVNELAEGTPLAEERHLARHQKAMQEIKVLKEMDYADILDLSKKEDDDRNAKIEARMVSPPGAHTDCKIHNQYLKELNSLEVRV